MKRSSHKTYFLGIGLNSVNPAKYDGWDGRLNACHNDVTGWESAIRQRVGAMESIRLFDHLATIDEVQKAYVYLAEQAKAGSRIFVVRSGHGSYATDYDGDETNGRDELHVLYDGLLSDDQHALWLARFAPGVEGTLIFDTCHSETAAKAVMPIDGDGAEAGVAMAPAKWRPKFLPRAIAQRLAPPKIVGESPVIASCWRTLAACKDNQVAYDGDVNGAFTAAAIAVLNTNWNGTYNELMRRVRNTVQADQSPQIPPAIGGTASQRRSFNSRKAFE